MEAVAQPLMEWPHQLAWFRQFLKEELAPYPGRTALVARMTISAILLMLITMIGTRQSRKTGGGEVTLFTVARQETRGN